MSSVPGDLYASPARREAYALSYVPFLLVYGFIRIRICPAGGAICPTHPISTTRATGRTSASTAGISSQGGVCRVVCLLPFLPSVPPLSLPSPYTPSLLPLAFSLLTPIPSDLLSRHVNKCHAAEKASAGALQGAGQGAGGGPRRKTTAAATRATTSKQACDQCVQASLPCDGSNPCAKCIARKTRCTFVKFHRQTAPVGPGHPSSVALSAASSSGSASSMHSGSMHGGASLHAHALPSSALGHSASSLSLASTGSSSARSVADLEQQLELEMEMEARARPGSAHSRLGGVGLLDMRPASSHGMIHIGGAGGMGGGGRPSSSHGMIDIGGGNADGRPGSSRGRELHPTLAPSTSTGGGGAGPFMAYAQSAPPGMYAFPSAPASQHAHHHPHSSGSSGYASSAESYGGYGASGGGGASAFEQRDYERGGAGGRIGYDQQEQGQGEYGGGGGGGRQEGGYVGVSGFSSSCMGEGADSSVFSFFFSAHQDYGVYLSNGHRAPPSGAHHHPEFSSAFGLMSLDDPNVLAGLAADGVPFFAGGQQTTSHARGGGPGTGLTPLGGMTPGVAGMLGGTDKRMQLVPPPAMAFQPYASGGGEQGQTPGTQREMETRELREFWKAYMRTPLSGPDAAMGGGGGGGGGEWRAGDADAGGEKGQGQHQQLPPLQHPHQQQQQHQQQQAQQGPPRTQHNADDLRSYEAAVLARKAPELVLRKPGRRPTTSAGVSSQQQQQPQQAHAQQHPEHHHHQQESPPFQFVGRERGGAGSAESLTSQSPTQSQNASQGQSQSQSQSQSSLAGAFGFSAQGYAASGSVPNSPFPGTPTSTTSTSASASASASEDGDGDERARPAFKRLPSQALAPAVAKRRKDKPVVQPIGVGLGLRTPMEGGAELGAAAAAGAGGGGGAGAATVAYPDRPMIALRAPPNMTHPQRRARRLSAPVSPTAPAFTSVAD
ncbi:hypothetical protein C8J57DRAFT_1576890 [Mycena rebaudengoi]|nr:hypothetical protein C8J57DRAFT_1576890 [Mycena rebaudengoi]